MQQEEPNKYVKELTQEKYKYGFTTDVHTDIIERGLNEDVVRLISEKKGEPEWLLEFRLKAYRHWLTLGVHMRIAGSTKIAVGLLRTGVLCVRAH